MRVIFIRGEVATNIVLLRLTGGSSRELIVVEFCCSFIQTILLDMARNATHISKNNWAVGACYVFRNLIFF